jgi:hypothetical protein
MEPTSYQLGRSRLEERAKNKVIGWEMTPDQAVAFFKDQGKTVLTFFGYSGNQYEDTSGLINVADRVLFQHSPEHTLVNIGATDAGVGAIYRMAKSKGFITTGIVSQLALEYPDDISEAVDFICFIKDTQWGGKISDSDELSPTSQAMVLCSDILIGIGGGEVSRDEMIAGKAMGKSVRFYPAEANHDVTIRRATKLGQPKPESFWGAAHDVFNGKEFGE